MMVLGERTIPHEARVGEPDAEESQVAEAGAGLLREDEDGAEGPPDIHQRVSR